MSHYEFLYGDEQEIILENTFSSIDIETLSDENEVMLNTEISICQFNMESTLNFTENQPTNASTHSMNIEIQKDEQKKNESQFQTQSTKIKVKELKIEGKINERNEEENMIREMNEKLKPNDESKIYDKINTNSTQNEKIAPHKMLFKIQLKKLFCYNNTRQGRISRNRKDEILFDETYHSKFCKDNIFRKIKVMYHSFLLEFMNKIIEILFPSDYTKLKLHKINSNITQDVSIEFNRKLFNVKLWEFFSKDESKIFTAKTNNREIILYMKEKAENIKNILEMSYIDAYNELFVNVNSDILPKEFEVVLTNSPHLIKMIQKLEIKDSKYAKEVEIYARNHFQSYFENKKRRRGRKEKLNI